jgi:hypothetical protein
MKAIMSPPTGTNQRDDEDVMPRVEVIAKDLQEALRLGVKESPLLTFAVAGALGYMLAPPSGCARSRPSLIGSAWKDGSTPRGRLDNRRQEHWENELAGHHESAIASGNR